MEGRGGEGHLPLDTGSIVATPFLYSVFLTRIPAGSPGVLSWSRDEGKLAGVECTGLFFGDYDIHAMVPIREAPVMLPPALRERSADWHEMMVVDLCTRATPLHERWRRHARACPVFCMVTMGVQRDLLAVGGLPFLDRMAAALGRTIDEHCARAGFKRARREVLASLGSSDLVCYLFGDDIERLDGIVLALRSLTLGDLRRGAGPDAALVGAIDGSGLADDLHAFHWTYTMHGVMPGPDGSIVTAPADIARRITSRRTRLRPMLFVGTFPGHEGDARLRELTSPCGAVLFTSGIFDLVIPVVSPSFARARPSQRDVLERTLSLLRALWCELGPGHPERATVVRTNTVLTRRGAFPDVVPHGLPRGSAPPRPIDLRDGPLAPAWEIVSRLRLVLNSATANRLSASLVGDLHGAVEALADALSAEEVLLVTLVKAASPQEVAMRVSRVLSALQEAARQLEGVLVARLAGVHHTIREEVAPRQAGALQKILTFYRELCERFLDAHGDALDVRRRPAIVLAVDGVYKAQSWRYFERLDGRPRLLILHLREDHLLRPAHAFLALVHELMHDFAPPWVGELVADAALEEFIECVVGLAGPALRRIARAGDHDDTPVRRGLRRDFESFCAHARQVPDFAVRPTRLAVVWDFLHHCVHAPGYLMVLLLNPEGGSEPAPPIDPEGVRALMQVHAMFESEVDALRSLVTESLPDLLAARLTDGDRYLAMLEDEPPDAALAARRQILRDVLHEADAAPGSTRPLVRAFLDVTRRLKREPTPAIDRAMVAGLTRAGARDFLLQFNPPSKIERP